METQCNRHNNKKKNFSKKNNTQWEEKCFQMTFECRIVLGFNSLSISYYISFILWRKNNNIKLELQKFYRKPLKMRCCFAAIIYRMQTAKTVIDFIVNLWRARNIVWRSK